MMVNVYLDNKKANKRLALQNGSNEYIKSNLLCLKSMKNTEYIGKNSVNESEKNNLGEVHKEIGSLLSEHAASIITGEQTKLLQNELGKINADHTVTQNETVGRQEFIQSLGLEEDYEAIQEITSDGINQKEFQQLKKVGYTKADFKRLIQHYKERKNNRDNKDTLQEVFQTTKVGETLELIESTTKENAGSLTTQTVQEQIAFFLQEQEKLKEEEKKEFLQRLRELIIMQYLEGKQLEVYEISVDENGNIIIKAKGGQTIIIPVQNIKKLGKEFISNKMKKVLSEKDLQKLLETIEQQEKSQKSIQTTIQSGLEKIMNNL